MLWGFVKSTRFFSQSMRSMLESADKARRREQLAHLLWNYLEQHPGAIQHDIGAKLSASQEETTAIVELWERLGILDRKTEDRSYRLHFRTSLDAEVDGACPACGVRGRGRKELFFRSAPCQRCGTKGHYYIEYGELR
jgi:hypothetical protein